VLFRSSRYLEKSHGLGIDRHSGASRN